MVAEVLSNLSKRKISPTIAQLVLMQQKMFLKIKRNFLTSNKYRDIIM